MAALNRLTDRQVKAATVGKHNDGGGLWLIKRPDGGAQWIFRFTIHGKRPEMGLGAYPMVSLAQARQQAEQWRGYVLKGINPIQERARQSREGAKGRPTLAAMAVEAFEARKRTLLMMGRLHVRRGRCGCMYCLQSVQSQ